MLKLIANKKALDHNHVLIVTTNTHERDALLRAVTKPLKLTTGSSGRRAYLGHVNNALVVVLDASGGYSDPNSATRFAQTYIKDPSNPTPALVLMSGICWGNPTMVEIGEVIVSDTVRSANRWTAKPDEKDFKTYTIASTARTEELLADSPVKVRTGELISLEVRLMDEATRNVLLSKIPTALGGEMEAFALVPDCGEIPWLVVKAVSDFGTFLEGRDTQPSAASNAAHVVSHLMSRFALINAADLDEAQSELRDDLIRAMNGKHLQIDITELNRDNINGSIHAYFRQVERSVALHTNALAVHADLARDAAKLTLEIASNAFKHGRARKVQFRFEIRGISYEDDGTEFDVTSLPAIEHGRGGRGTYASFSRRHFISQDVSLVQGKCADGNRLGIDISSEVPNLPSIIATCSAAVDHVAMARRELALRWADTCEVVYIDFDNIGMMSTILDLCEELVLPIASGRKFVVLCSDADTVTEVTDRYPAQVADGSISFIPAP